MTRMSDLLRMLSMLADLRERSHMRLCVYTIRFLEIQTTKCFTVYMITAFLIACQEIYEEGAWTRCFSGSKCTSYLSFQPMRADLTWCLLPYNLTRCSTIPSTYSLAVLPVPRMLGSPRSTLKDVSPTSSRRAAVGQRHPVPRQRPFSPRSKEAREPPLRENVRWSGRSSGHVRLWSYSGCW